MQVHPIIQAGSTGSLILQDGPFSSLHPITRGSHYCLECYDLHFSYLLSLDIALRTVGQMRNARARGHIPSFRQDYIFTVTQSAFLLSIYL